MLPPDSPNASDGSGNGVRLSSLLAFAVPLLFVGSALLLLGKRGWRATTGMALGLVLALTTWAIAVTAQGDMLLGGSLDKNALGFLLGSLLGAWKLWPLGIGCLGLAAGFSLGLQICLLGNDGTIHVLYARWIVIGVLAVVTCVLNIFLFNFSSAICSAQIGAFCFFLGLDLLINVDRGWSRGLRYVLDGNADHRELLANYDLPVSSRVLVPIAWLIAIIFSYLQLHFYRAPFIRRTRHTRERVLESDPELGHEAPRDSMSKSPMSGSPTSPSYPAGPAIVMRETSTVRQEEPASRPGSLLSDQRSIFSALTQQFRAHWAGALSQYGSSIDLSTRPALSRGNSASQSILHPLRALNPDYSPPMPSHFSDATRATTAAATPGLATAGDRTPVPRVPPPMLSTPGERGEEREVVYPQPSTTTLEGSMQTARSSVGDTSDMTTASEGGSLESDAATARMALREDDAQGPVWKR